MYRGSTKAPWSLDWCGGAAKLPRQIRISVRFDVSQSSHGVVELLTDSSG